MYKSKKIAVVIRAYNEEKTVASVIKGIPPYVDRIFMVDDASNDNTRRIIEDVSTREERLHVLHHNKRYGAGSAAITGYKQALIDNMDIIALFDGDGQMNSEILELFLDPLITNEADFTKGNRLSTAENKREMPIFRVFGNYLLSILTKLASGYWNVNDPQNGYTAINKDTLGKLDLDKIYRGFAFENDMLVKLNVIGARVEQIEHAALYRGQISKIRYFNFITSTSWILFKDFFWRIWEKYIKSYK